MGNPDVRPKDATPGKAQALRSQMLDPADAVRLARQAQALSDATRVNLLLLIREATTACVSDLCVVTEREQSGISRHLRILYDVGLVTRRRLDLWVLYEITDDGKRLLAALLDS